MGKVTALQFVSEWSSHCLSIFDPQANKIHTVGSLNYPRGIAIDPIEGSVYVAVSVEVLYEVLNNVMNQ